MKINLDEIPKDGLSLDLEEKGADLEKLAGGLGFIIASPVKAHLDVNTATGGVYLAGRLATRLELTCDRCASTFERDVESSFHVFFVRGTEDKREKGLDMADMEVNFIGDAEEVDTTEVLLAQVALEMPSKNLCRPDCKGLCPRCGADLNEGDCGCPREERIDPRLEKLKDFKLK